MDIDHALIVSFVPGLDPDVLRADSSAVALALSTSVIPDGMCCYKATGISVVSGGARSLKICVCPYWATISALPHQTNGYCAFTKSGDWQDGVGLLWDQVKECGVNDDPDGDFDDVAIIDPMACDVGPAVEADFSAIMALHRGFREQCNWSGTTDFTSHETPLPNLTWGNQKIENIKRWLDQGGFDWEVDAALKRKAKVNHEDTK